MWFSDVSRGGGESNTIGLPNKTILHFSMIRLEINVESNIEVRPCSSVRLSISSIFIPGNENSLLFGGSSSGITARHFFSSMLQSLIIHIANELELHLTNCPSQLGSFRRLCLVV